MMLRPRPRALFFALCATVASLSAQTARLVNISTNGQVGTDFNNMVGGFVISGGPKTVLIRAIGPGLGAFGVPGTLADPFLTLFDGASKAIATNDDWSIADLPTMTAAGAFALPANSKDAVLVRTLQPGSYTAQISGNGAKPSGAAILEIYDVGGSGQLINIATRLQAGSGGNTATAGFVISPGSGTRKLLIRGIGPALAGFGLPGTLADPKLIVYDANANVIGTAVANGSVSAVTNANTQAGAFGSSAGDATTILTVPPGSYTVQLSSNANGSPGVALVEVYDITTSTGTPANLAADTPTLYYAGLRPAAAATNSMASGYATVLFDPNTHIASVSVSFSNLTSATTSAHLVIDSAASGNFVLNLPRAQSNGITWTFPATGPFSSTDLINALQSGRIFISIDSATFPNGELQGGLIRTTGSTAFTAPAAPPALAANALTAPSQTDAARFLTQATFGPTAATIAALQTRGITGWIDDQLAAPATSMLASFRADLTAFPKPPQPAILGAERYAWENDWHGSWWRVAVTAPDQLRQRVAFALSEILVVGRQDDLDFNLESKPKYYDLLVNRAFGNFRALLEDVTLSPAMGVWLSHRGNVKANPTKGTAPDENYAREVQQLFSIGLVQLQPDGSLVLDAAGQPIPTYNQATITETAKVLTGWTFAGNAANINEGQFTASYPPEDLSKVYPAHLPDNNSWLVPMGYFDAFHDKTAKRIVSLQQVPLAQATPTAIPANQTGPQDLKALLDTLANHPNTAPFLSRQLIQRLVTSNPSPGYVYRVAQVWRQQKDSPTQLGAVVRAILTDYEARSPDVLGNFGYGKIKEPLIRLAAFLRALNGAAPNGQYIDSYWGDPAGPLSSYLPFGGVFTGPMFSLGQSPMFSPTVFNFYSPTYSPPGAMAAAGLVAPELQIVDSTFSILAPNQFTNLMYRDITKLPQTYTGASPYIVLDYTALLPNAKNPSTLIDQLSLLFCGNQMTTATRNQIVTTLNALPPAATDLERVQTAIQFTISSPDGALQK